MKTHTLFVMFILLTALTWSGSIPHSLTFGPAPDFTLDSLNGDAVTLSDLEGPLVMLDFWATWCGLCVEGLSHFQQLHERYASQGVVVLAINVGEIRDEVSDFMNDHDYTFTVLLDTDDSVKDTYGVWGIPHMVIVDREGEIHYVPGGPDDVEDALRQLLEE